MIDSRKIVSNICKRLAADFSLVYNNTKEKWTATIYKTGGQTVASAVADNPQKVIEQLVDSVG